MLVDVGVSGYILLYCLNLYNVSDETLKRWNTPKKDIATVKKVQLQAIHNVFHLLNTVYCLGGKVHGNHVQETVEV